MTARNDSVNSRFLSLDVFRGMTVCFMILVNTPGSGSTPFAPLLHAKWHGFTVTDLVFPAFLFAVGNAISFTARKGLPANTFLLKVIKRTAWIFFLGYLLYWFPFFETNSSGELVLKPVSETRILGVLQRIALCYFFAALMIEYLSERMIVILSIVFLLGYWFLLLIFGNPDDPYSMFGNAGYYLDKLILGENHLSRFEAAPFEAQGLLSTIPAIVLVVIGYLAGKFIQTKGKNFESVAKLLLAGCLFVFIAICWDPAFPINKKLWTSSFILLTSGLSLIILSALLYIIEIMSWNIWNWAGFFTVFGKNPLFIYLLAELTSKLIHRINVGPETSIHEAISTGIFQSVTPGPVGSLLFAISFMLVCWLIGWILDRKAIYIKV